MRVGFAAAYSRLQLFSKAPTTMPWQCFCGLGAGYLIIIANVKLRKPFLIFVALQLHVKLSSANAFLSYRRLDTTDWESLTFRIFLSHFGVGIV